MKAVVLAAGKGTRMQPITSTRPKHLIKAGGRPLLDHCLDSLKACGITEIVMVVNFMADSIRSHISDGKKLGVSVQYVEQKEVIGTGNAVGVVEPFVEDDFLVTHGDLLFTPDIVREIVQSHKDGGQLVTMAIVPVAHCENYGMVNLKDEGSVKSIVEKPNPEDVSNKWANAGIYVFSTEIFGKIREISASSRGEIEVTDAISLLLAEGKQISAVKIAEDDWVDVGRPWDLLEANSWALKRADHEIRGNIETGAHLLGQVTVAHSVRIRSGTYIEGPAFLDKGCDIGPNCYIRPHTSVGKNVRIGSACEIKNSVVMDGAHIGHLSYVGDSIIGENCNLGAGTVTANFRLDGESIKMRIGDLVSDSHRRKLGVVLGDGVKAGVNALFMPGVKVGPESQIGPNVVVYRDVAADSKILLKQELAEE